MGYRAHDPKIDLLPAFHNKTQFINIVTPKRDNIYK